jgi:hypothetical protein
MSGALPIFSLRAFNGVDKDNLIFNVSLASLLFEWPYRNYVTSR